MMMVRAGCKDMEIMKTACVARNTVKSIRSELEESNNDYEKTPEFVEKLQKKVQEDPSRSRTKLVEELGVGNTTVRVCINKDLRPESPEQVEAPLHNETLWFYSDKKNFTQDQNTTARITGVPIVAQTKFPAAVMVFGIISSDGDVMPPHFFPKGLRLDSEGYVALMKDKVAAGRPYVFQQDSAPCHTSHKTQKWLRPTPPIATRATSTYGAMLRGIPTELLAHHGRVEGPHHALLQEVAEGPGQVRKVVGVMARTSSRIQANTILTTYF
ncbi:Uncharacterized protein FKW44_006909 [Caligus rogercresseyi]|uniref:Uncharacterized protein n=1 Tax=Caligus rogercresseyi TaxID=217165 RepID=A0A7T8QT83_CALRO|nr:Uncharacterized protein FKW44_006909 [Caligus rogercresseyi]